MQGTVLMALLQPAPEVYDLFDDIMLLCEGELMLLCERGVAGLGREHDDGSKP